MKTIHITESVMTLAGAAMVCSTSLQAAAALYEGFDYADDGHWEVNGKSGGDGWGPTVWTATKNGTSIQAPGTSYGDLEVSGNTGISGLELWSDSKRATGTALSSAGLLTDGSTLWFSILVDNTDSGWTNSKTGFFIGDDGFSSGGFDAGTASGTGVGIWRSGSVLNSNSGNFEAGSFGTGITKDMVDTGIAPGGPTLLVGEIVWGAEFENETINIYTPDLLGNPGGLVATHSFGDVNQAGYDTVGLRLKSYSKLDEIRFGASYADVVPVPEPSTALLGLGGPQTPQVARPYAVSISVRNR